MKNIIGLLEETELTKKLRCDKDDLDDYNDVIKLYNILEEGTPEKALVGEYLWLIFTNPIGEIYRVDIGKPLKEDLTEEDEEKIAKLDDLVKEIKLKYQHIINLS